MIYNLRLWELEQDLLHREVNDKVVYIQAPDGKKYRQLMNGELLYITPYIEKLLVNIEHRHVDELLQLLGTEDAIEMEFEVVCKYKSMIEILLSPNSYNTTTILSYNIANDMIAYFKSVNKLTLEIEEKLTTFADKTLGTNIITMVKYLMNLDFSEEQITKILTSRIWIDKSELIV